MKYPTERAKELERLGREYGVEKVDPYHSCLWTAKQVCIALKGHSPRIIWWNIYKDPENIDSEGHAYVTTSLHQPSDKPFNRRRVDDFDVDWLLEQDIEDITDYIMSEDDSKL